jgi:hypothetical protein
MYGPNPLDIAARLFLKTTESPNSRDPGAYGRQTVRHFSFVLNDEDWHRLITDLNSYRDAEKMLHEIDVLGRGHGTLTILDMHRSVNNGMAIFDWIQFRVVLRWPEK